MTEGGSDSNGSGSDRVVVIVMVVEVTEEGGSDGNGDDGDLDGSTNEHENRNIFLAADQPM